MMDCMAMEEKCIELRKLYILHFILRGKSIISHRETQVSEFPSHYWPWRRNYRIEFLGLMTWGTWGLSNPPSSTRSLHPLTRVWGYWFVGEIDLGLLSQKSVSRQRADDEGGNPHHSIHWPDVAESLRGMRKNSLTLPCQSKYMKQ